MFRIKLLVLVLAVSLFFWALNGVVDAAITETVTNNNDGTGTFLCEIGGHWQKIRANDLYKHENIYKNHLPGAGLASISAMTSSYAIFSFDTQHPIIGDVSLSWLTSLRTEECKAVASYSFDHNGPWKPLWSSTAKRERVSVTFNADGKSLFYFKISGTQPAEVTKSNWLLLWSPEWRAPLTVEATVKLPASASADKASEKSVEEEEKQKEEEIEKKKEMSRRKYPLEKDVYAFLPCDETNHYAIPDIAGDNFLYLLGTQNTNSAWKPGKIGYGIWFDGTSGGALRTCRNLSVLKKGSVELFFKLDDDFSKGKRRIYPLFEYQCGKEEKFLLKIERDGHLRLEFHSAKNRYTIDSDSTTWQTNRWYHVAVIQDGKEAKMYIDDTEQTGKGSAGWFADIAIDEGTVRLGHNKYGDHFKGTMDEICLKGAQSEKRVSAAKWKPPARIKPRELEISPSHPLFVWILNSAPAELAGNISGSLSWYWQDIPEDIRPYSVVMTAGYSTPNPEWASTFDYICKKAEEAKVPTICQARYILSCPEQGEVTLPDLEKAFKKYSYLKGIHVVELTALNPSYTRDYLMKALKLCAAYGKVIVWEDCHEGGQPFLECLLDKEFYDTLVKYKDYIIPAIHGAVNLNAYECHGSILGLWLADAANDWCIKTHPGEFWLEAGLKKLGEKSLGWRKGDCKPAPAQFCIQQMLTSASSGATVYWLYRRPWDKGGIRGRDWNNVVAFFRMLINNKVIPSKEEAKERIKIAYQANKEDYIYFWDDKVSHSGKYSLKITNPGGLVSIGELRLNPTVMSPTPFTRGRPRNCELPEPGRVYTLSFWVKTEDATGAALLAWFYPVSGGRRYALKPRIERKEISNTDDWQKITLKTKAEEGDVMGSMFLYIKEGTAWFDDVSLTAEGSDKNLIFNPGFEEKVKGQDYAPAFWVLRWAPEGRSLEAYADPISSMFKATYGMRHDHEWIPNNSRYFWVPIISRFARDKGHYKKIVDYSSKTVEEFKKIFDRYYPPVDTEGFVCEFKDIVIATNSYENTDIKEKVKAEVGPYRIEASLGPHNYFIANGNDDRLEMLVDNRANRTTKIKIFSQERIRIENPDENTTATWEKNVLSVSIKHQEGNTPVRFTVIK